MISFVENKSITNTGSVYGYVSYNITLFRGLGALRYLKWELFYVVQEKYLNLHVRFMEIDN